MRHHPSRGNRLRKGLPAIRRHAAALALGFAVAGAAASAAAQQPPTPPVTLTSPPAWAFNIAPYVWLPKIDATLDYNLPPALGGRLPTSTSSGVGDYFPHLKFAAMLSADVRYGAFSALTDFMYVNAGTSQTNIRSLDFFGLPSQPLSKSLETGTSSTLKSTIWTLAGGYTVLQRDWGSLDVIAGFRLADMEARTDYNLALTVTGPRGNGATFGGPGTISGHGQNWNGIVGARGSVSLGTAGFFIPYYFDIGTGSSDLTWQIASGIGYRTGRISMSAQYRYLSFRQDAVIQHLSLADPFFAHISF